MLNKYLLNNYGSPGTVLGAEHRAVNEKDFCSGHKRMNKFCANSVQNRY